MADRLQGSASQRRNAPASIGFNPEGAGRGPTYERVQRLLEERRARAQAQTSTRAQLGSNAASSGPVQQGRFPRPFSSPESDDSFAFDRAPYTSNGGDLDAIEEHASSAHHQHHGSEVSSVYSQVTWQHPAQFEIPTGQFDGDDGGSYGAGPSNGAKAHVQRPGSYGGAFAADGGDEEVHGRDGDTHLDPHSKLRQQDAGLRPDDVDADGHTLAELEQMLNHTIQQYNIEEMRVPTSKDMAYGMAHGDGPFDISDIWAVESQLSGSQCSATQRQASRSEGGFSRDDGHEVNSYVQPSSVSRDSSYASGHESQPTLVTARVQQMDALPGSAQAQMRSARQPESQPQQRLPQQQRQHQLGAGARPSVRIHSGAGALEVPRRQQHQQSLLAQPSRAHLARQAQDKGGDADAAILRRAGTPTRRAALTQQKMEQPRALPHYTQPTKSTVASLSPGRAPEPSEGFTFKPQINPRSREIAERLLPFDKERRLEQLSRPRNDRVEQRCQQLRQAKEEEELRDCTFQPQTGRPPSIPRLRGEQPVHDRLYNVKPAWQLRREEILREREEAVLASCTFQPQCGSRQTLDDARRSMSAARRRPASASAGYGGESTPYVPIHQRVADLLRSRNEKLAKAQVKKALDGGSVTFQPEINRRSAALAAERQRQQPAEVAALPASERLYRLAQEQQELRRRGAGDEPGSVMPDVSASRDQRLSFQSQQQQPWGVPTINPRSRALAESSDLPQDFLARQAYLAALGHEKRALYRSLLEESTCTFQPQLLSRAGSLNSSCAFGSNTPRGGGGGGGGSRWSGSVGEGDRLSKLAYEDVQRSVALRDALQQHHYGQYTFTPAINERSRRIGRRHSLTDLYRDDERQSKMERLVAAAEAERAAECTFRPAINARSASLGRQRRGSLVLASAEAHEQAIKLRSSILTEARALREYEELKECTFTPAINRTVPKPAGPIAVPGLGRYMELKDLARRKREAEELRKEEVWNIRPRSPGPPAGVTVPRPFSFETRVMPWQAPREQMIRQQQDQEQQQRKALAVLKQQRQQQRRDAEERRSAQLHKIMLEAQGGAHQTSQQHRYLERAASGGGANPALATAVPPSAMQQVRPASAGAGRRRTVCFVSPSTGTIYGRDASPRGVAEMPAGADRREPQRQASPPHVRYGEAGSDGNRDEFEFAGAVVQEERSVRFYVDFRDEAIS